VNPVDTNTLELQLLELRSEHRDLDEIIQEMSHSRHPDQLKIQRLKRRKLSLKDSIKHIESMLIPDLDA
jgi:hypothetical protein